MVNKERAANIAAPHDAFRQQPLLKGKLLITPGVQLLGEQFVTTTIVAFMGYNDLNSTAATCGIQALPKDA